jgi:hypothetical protein
VAPVARHPDLPNARPGPAPRTNGAAAVARRAAAVFLLAGTMLTHAAPAQQPQEPPAERKSERPLLEQLNRETQALYEEAVGGLVRVELPTPPWASPIARRDELLKRWPNLRPEVKRQLGEAADAPPPPTTQPAEGEGRQDEAGGADTIVVVPARPDPPAVNVRQQVLGGRMEAGGAGAGGAFDPNNVGMIHDDDGHLLVPLYLESEAAGAGAIRVAGRDGVVREASFVGSDRQTNLTVLKLRPAPPGNAAAAGPAVRLGTERPADGALVLYVAPQDGSGRLGVWTGAATDFGIVFTTDGAAAGIARYGRFLNGPACRLIADQIIRFGKVKRATLGVVISEIRQDDALRRSVPALGSRAAMLISQVIPGSPADQAGLREGDLLLSLSGEAVGDIPSLAAAIASCDGSTRLQVLRGGKTVDAVVELKQE